jgi:hypothetical protein
MTRSLLSYSAEKGLSVIIQFVVVIGPKDGAELCPSTPCITGQGKRGIVHGRFLISVDQLVRLLLHPSRFCISLEDSECSSISFEKRRKAVWLCSTILKLNLLQLLNKWRKQLLLNHL